MVMDDKATGEQITLEIVRNMHESLEPLLFKVLAPSLYHVYLHEEDYVRLEGVFLDIIEDAKKALDGELKRLNNSALPGFLRFLKRKGKQYQPAQGGWYISFHRDAGGELKKGDIEIVSELALPPKPELGVGAKTIRLTTIRTGDETKTRREIRQEEQAEEPLPSSRTYAKITYEDNHGRQTYVMTKDQIVIGRGGRDYWVDLKLYTSPDVSREHLRLRRDERTGQFYVKDLSRLGTTVNGETIPSSIEIINDDDKRDKNIEVPLPPRARIGLADTVFLDFEATSKL